MKILLLFHLKSSKPGGKIGSILIWGLLGLNISGLYGGVILGNLGYYGIKGGLINL